MVNTEERIKTGELVPLYLHWHKLHRIDDFEANQSKKSSQRGVYVWGFESNGEFIPYYVGKAKNLFGRIVEHYAGLRGGAYSIYHRESLSEFYNHKDGPVNEKFNKGLLYRPMGPFALAKQFLHDDVQIHVQYMVETVRYTFAFVNDPIFDLAGVEQSLADHFGREFLQAKITRGAKRYGLRYEGDPQVLQMFLVGKTQQRPIRIPMP